MTEPKHPAVSLKDLAEMCRFFGVEFSITGDADGVVYHFGDASWTVFGELSYPEFIEINLLLAANFPERVFLRHPNWRLKV